MVNTSPRWLLIENVVLDVTAVRGFSIRLASKELKDGGVKQVVDVLTEHGHLVIYPLTYSPQQIFDALTAIVGASRLEL